MKLLHTKYRQERTPLNDVLFVYKDKAYWIDLDLPKPWLEPYSIIRKYLAYWLPVPLNYKDTFGA